MRYPRSLLGPSKTSLSGLVLSNIDFSTYQNQHHYQTPKALDKSANIIN
jgi:hypothetical protein